MVSPVVHPAELVPDRANLATARLAAFGCRACELWERATQTVFGEGPLDASLLLAGEQPGDREDIEGHPFVGPAGRVLDEALEAAGIDRERIFVTNVVKHFRWRIDPDVRLPETRGVLLDPLEPGGPRRLATIHPSAILRLRDADERASSREQLAADLATAAAAAGM